jgi:hypothetical protein
VPYIAHPILFYCSIAIARVPQVPIILSSNDARQAPRGPHSNDAKLFLISILKALEGLETFRSGLVGQSFITRKTGASGRF